MDPLHFTPDDRWQRAHRAAEIIEQARGMVVPKLAQRIAAQQAGIDPTYWPVVIRGWRKARGVQSPVVPPDDTLLRMAAAVGVERQVREILGLEIPDRLIARQPGDDPDIEVTIQVPPEEYHLLADEDRAHIDALVRRLAAKELGRPGGSDRTTGQLDEKGT